MTDLIACLSSGKGTWGHVNRLIEDGNWEKVFLITNEFGKENFSNTKNAEMIVIDERKGLEDLRDDIYKFYFWNWKGAYGNASCYFKIRRWIKICCLN